MGIHDRQALESLLQGQSARGSPCTRHAGHCRRPERTQPARVVPYLAEPAGTQQSALLVNGRLARQWRSRIGSPSTRRQKSVRRSANASEPGLTAGPGLTLRPCKAAHRFGMHASRAGLKSAPAKTLAAATGVCRRQLASCAGPGPVFCPTPPGVIGWSSPDSSNVPMYQGDFLKWSSHCHMTTQAIHANTDYLFS